MHVIASFTKLSYKQLPFAGCKIALFGFKGEEELEMVETAAKNGKENNHCKSPNRYSSSGTWYVCV